jgi:prepilin-type processing-associated H-X9-DG protein
MENRGMKKADVIALGLVLFVLGTLVPTLIADARRDGANRAYCAANLRGIMQSMVIYSAEENDQYPCVAASSAVTYDATLKPMLGDKDSAATLKRIYKQKELTNNPAAALWMLALRNHVSPKQFICKSDPFAGKPAELQKGKDQEYFQNFQDGKNLSYSMAYPWQEDKKGKPQGGAWWKNTTDSSLPILSDMAPYLSAKAGADEIATRPATAPATGPDAPLVLGGNKNTGRLTSAVSSNHDFTGMNVAFADAHAEWTRLPDIGQSNDNIWAATIEKTDLPIDAGQLPGKLTATNPPFDIVMVPTRSAKGDLK